jgi:hypothetical protein
MELLLGVTALVVLAVLAPRFGYDSREGIQSKEVELARFGMQWPGRDGARVARPPSLRRRVRRQIARALLALGDKLYPGSAPLTRAS